ncbi:hypothetical protein GARC_1382 [Paraglaciecola arctica BSs20135]|uniref:Uncharacterized protein n=1 Tax=Paraglaciecola arctica BSs20135 TaxID=493475 RepID=K6YJL8_9ALTE|nr:hypothetical protein GARC_1382 [Paraglaciecola arctica BSs20135]
MAQLGGVDKNISCLSFDSMAKIELVLIVEIAPGNLCI